MFPLYFLTSDILAVPTAGILPAGATCLSGTGLLRGRRGERYTSHLHRMKTLKAYFSLVLPFVALAHAESQPEFRAGGKLSPTAFAKPIRLILTDLDGTLAEGETEFFEPNPTAFAMARLLGIQVAIASGRPRGYSFDIIGEENAKRMGYYGIPGVYLNGSYVLGPNGEVMRDVPLAPDIVERALRIIEEEGALRQSRAMNPKGLLDYKGSRDNLDVPIHKLHFEGNEELVAKVRARIAAELGDRISFRQSHGRSFQIVTPGCDKGEGLLQLCAELGIAPDEVLVLGNAFDDLPMFAVAGTSVAVGNAYDPVKEAANYVTVRHTEGALFEVVREIIRRGLYPDLRSGNKVILDARSDEGADNLS